MRWRFLPYNATISIRIILPNTHVTTTCVLGNIFLMANAFASRLCNIQDDDTATDRKKVHARNTQKALETSISFRRLVATVRAPEGKDQLLTRKDRKRERIRGFMRRPIPRSSRPRKPENGGYCRGLTVYSTKGYCKTSVSCFLPYHILTIPRMKGLLSFLVLGPALRMRSATDRALACRWHLGTFPIHCLFLCSIGLQNYLDDLKPLTKKKTSPIEGENKNCTEAHFEHTRTGASDRKSRLTIVRIETSRLPAYMKVLASLK